MIALMGTSPTQNPNFLQFASQERSPDDPFYPFDGRLNAQKALASIGSPVD
jgi:hypothetical protein